MGAAFTKCCFDATEDTKKNPVSSAFEVIGETCSESSTNNEIIQPDNLKHDEATSYANPNTSPTSAEDFVVSQREKSVMKYSDDAHISCSQRDLRLLMQTMPVDLDTRDTILEKLIREEELALNNEENDDD